LPGGFDGLRFPFFVERQPPLALEKGHQERATDAKHDHHSHDDIERCR
jgi:hypothetical protein